MTKTLTVGIFRLWRSPQIILPVIRMGLSILLLKVVADKGGYLYLDAVALAIAISPFFVIFSVPGILRTRAFLGHTLSPRRSNAVWILVIPSAVFCVLGYFLTMTIGVTLLAYFHFFKNAIQFFTFFFVLSMATAALALLPIEHICGRLGLQNALRRSEFILFILIGILAIALRSAFLAASVAYISTILARILIYIKNRPAGSIASRNILLKHFQPSRRGFSYWIFGEGGQVLLANLFQATSSAVIYGVTFKTLPHGVISEISIAYRFAGPIQIVSGQLAYSTWSLKDVKSAATSMMLLSIFAAGMSLSLPYFFSSILKLEGGGASPWYGLFACIHLFAQGVCQIKSAQLYAAEKYNNILISTLPHVILMFVGLILVANGLIQNIELVLLLLLFPTLVELSLLLIPNWRLASPERIRNEPP